MGDVVLSAGPPETGAVPGPPSRPAGGRAPRSLAALAGVLLVYVAMASFIAVRTPAWESADEFGHVDNVETLVSGHWYRIDTHCWSPKWKQLCVDNEVHQPPLYYLLMAGWQHVVGLASVPPEPNLGAGPGTVSARGEDMLRHPDRSLVLWLRIPNIVLGALTVCMAFVAARRVARDEWTPVVAAALVAFMPRFLFMSAFVTNDNLVTLLGAVLAWCALRFVHEPGARQMVATGAVFGLLVTTKLSVLPLALLLPLLALAAPSWRRRAALGAWGLGSAVAVSGWYLVQNQVRYGDPLARHASTRYLEQIGGLGTYLGLPYVVKDPLHYVVVDVPHKVLEYFWYTSGWNQFHWSLGVGVAITCCVGAVLFGLVGQRISKRVLAVLGAISVLSLACVWFVAFQTATYQPRYALVGLGAMAVLVALALQRWHVALRWVLPAAGVVGCLVAIHRDVLGVHWT